VRCYICGREPKRVGGEYDLKLTEPFWRFGDIYVCPDCMVKAFKYFAEKHKEMKEVAEEPTIGGSNLAEWLYSLHENGYKIALFKRRQSYYKIVLSIPEKYRGFKLLHYLYVSLDGSYAVSLIYGDASFRKYEIYDNEIKFEGVERYDTLEEAENRVVELMASGR